MRKFLIVVVVLALAAGAVVLYLALTTPKGSEGVRLPLTAGQREILSSVPADADAFALIPAAAAFHAKLAANPITRDAVADWSSRVQLPRPWMVGSADLVLWRSGKETSYAVRLDAFRAMLVRLWLMVGPDVEARSSGGTFIINATNAAPMDSKRLDQILALANGMPGGDALVVQQEGSRRAFPPMGRPAVTVLQVSRDDIVLVSRATADSGSGEASAPAGSRPPFKARFPTGALIAAQVADSPRVAGDLDRLFGARVSHLLDNGGSIVLYDVNTRTLLPRPDGVFVVPANAANRDTVQAISSVMNELGEIAEENGSIVIALDKQSLPAYRLERFVEASQPATDWAVRADPKRLVPLLDDLGDNTALRLATPRLYRSIRDLHGWIHYLKAAEAIEAEHAVRGGVEELRVRISAK